MKNNQENDFANIQDKCHYFSLIPEPIGKSRRSSHCQPKSYPNI